MACEFLPFQKFPFSIVMVLPPPPGRGKARCPQMLGGVWTPRPSLLGRFQKSGEKISPAAVDHQKIQKKMLSPIAHFLMFGWFPYKCSKIQKCAFLDFLLRSNHRFLNNFALVSCPLTVHRTNDFPACVEIRGRGGKGWVRTPPTSLPCPVFSGLATNLHPLAIQPCQHQRRDRLLVRCLLTYLLAFLCVAHTFSIPDAHSLYLLCHLSPMSEPEPCFM